MDNKMSDDAHLNVIGVLKRREIEARLVAPLLEAFSAEFGVERVREITRQVIVKIAQQQGAALAESMGGNDLSCFAASLAAWQKDDAMTIEVLQQDEARFEFNVRRCGYAEMYRSLGSPELGALLSCNRDHALIQGFNPNVVLQRTQTIMEGAEYCDFRYRLEGEA